MCRSGLAIWFEDVDGQDVCQSGGDTILMTTAGAVTCAAISFRRRLPAGHLTPPDTVHVEIVICALTEISDSVIETE